MKSLFPFILVFCCLFLWGCPYESSYPIDKEVQQSIDENLIGKWAAMVNRPAYEGDHREEPIKIIFEKRTDSIYDIAITGYLDDLLRRKLINEDTIKGTAYLSIVEKRQFLNAFIKGKVYIAEVIQKENSMSILTISDHFTSKFIKNSESLRNALSTHYNTRPVPSYDEWFIATNLQKVN